MGDTGGDGEEGIINGDRGREEEAGGLGVTDVAGAARDAGIIGEAGAE